MGNLWSRPVGWLKGLFAKKALEQPPAPVIPEVDFAPAVEPPPPVVMLEGVVPMAPDAPPLTAPASLIDLSWEDIGEAADQALPTDPLEGVEDAVDTPLGAREQPVEPEPAPVDQAEAPQPDLEPEPPQEPVQAEASPAPIMARVEPVPEPAVPDQSEGWLARLWDKVGPEEGEGLPAPMQAPGTFAPLLTDLDPFPVPDIVGGGALGFLRAPQMMGGL